MLRHEGGGGERAPGPRQIREKSPYLAKQIDAGTVGLVGALYDVTTGKVTFLEP